MIPGLNKRALNFYDLMLYVALVRKHLRLMILLLCMCVLGGVVLYVYSRPVYYAVSLVHVDSFSLPLDTDKIYHDGNLMAVITELTGPEVTQRTAARLGLEGQSADITAKYLRNLKVTTTADGNFQVEVWTYKPSLAAPWAQIMVDEFTKLRAERRKAFGDTINKAVGEEASEFNAKVNDDQSNSVTLENQAASTKAFIDVTSLKDLPTQIATVRQRIDQLEGIRNHLDDPALDNVGRLSLISSADAVAPVQIGQSVNLTSPASTSGSAAEKADFTATETVVVPGLVAEIADWPSLEKQQRQLLKEMADLSRIYLPGNQHMLAVRKQLDVVQRGRLLDYEIARRRLDFVCQTLHDRYANLQKMLPAYDDANRKYAQLQEAADLQRAGQLGWAQMYTEATKTISESVFVADKEKVNLVFDRVIQHKPEPVSPQKTKIILLSLAMGIAMAIGVPFLLEYLDYTLSNLEEVEATFQMRGLGIIPQVSLESNHPVLLDVATDGDSRNLVENFRVVRTNLLAMGTLSKPAHVTMITSAMPKEGKTVVSSNLAISFGQNGARTLLVDTDLRRGRLHRLFGLRKSPGLSDYLLEKVPLEEAIRPSGKDNLFILSAGQHIESGTELLGSAKFTELMQILRAGYDRIIIDTPPVLGLSETSVLQNHVDGILFVIWSGRTPIRNMKTAIDILSGNGANFYGFILNRLDLSTTMNYYQYYYYSSDYYHSYHALEKA